MKKSVIILLHLGFWLCYSLLLFLIFAASAPDDIPPAAVVTKLVLGFGFIPSVIGFYSFYFFLFENYLIKKKVGLLLFLIVVISMLSALTGELFLYLSLDKHGAMTTNMLAFLQITFFISLISLITGVVGLVMRGFVSWYADIELKQELAQENHEMELALVKAQLDPHFLFNTLNNIDVLIQKNAEEASIYLNKLSDIMRFMLFETKADSVPLKKELEYLQKYIDLQKIRSANPSFVKFVVDGSIEEVSIAPMVFMPFIENAFKHVKDKKMENAIDIEITVSSNSLIFVCVNNCGNEQIEQIGEFNGLGNDLIQKRLKLLYPNKYDLVVDNQNENYKVTLSIKL
jgi:two-component system LytT family sensor kinase